MFITHTKRICFWGIFVSLLLALSLCAPTFRAEGSYEEVLDKLDRLQTQAEAFSAQHEGEDPVVLTLAYTRTGTSYNTTLWDLMAGMRDAEFEAWVAANDPDCAMLQGVGLVTLPNGQEIDFSHLLASMNLVYNGLPIAGSWGGDCMELVQVYQGQAADTDGYYALMQGTFNISGDGSVFGERDLRADLDSVIVGSQLKENRIADALRSYYTDLTDYSRAYEFIAMSFGSVDTSNAGTLRAKVYDTLTSDTGMQLQLYTNGLWQLDGWTLAPDYEPAMQAACSLFADYLSAAVNGERVKSEKETRMVTIAGQALADALTVLGDTEAARAALEAHERLEEAASSASSSVTDIASAANNMRSKFDVKIFQLVLLILAALAVLGLVICIICILAPGKKKKRKR